MLDVLDDIKCRKSNIARHEKAVVALAYSFDGTLLATASADSTTQILDLKTGLKKTTLEGEHSLGLNDCCWVDERLLVTASDDNSLVLWDIEMGKAVTVMHGHTSYAYCVTVNPMNRTVLSGGYNGNVMIFDVTSGACIAGYNAHTEAITSTEYSAYGSCFITGSEDGFARIWDSATNAGCLHTIYTESRSPISSVTFAPNGQHLVVSSLDSIHRLFCYKSSSAYSSNSAGPKYLKSFKSHYNKRFSIISAVTSFRNKNVSGSYLVSGSEDNQVYIWDMNNDENKPVVLEGHTDIVLAVACHPDPYACQIVSASKDCTVKLWEPADRNVSEVNS